MEAIESGCKFNILASVLKIIAVVTMLTDHIGAVVIEFIIYKQLVSGITPSDDIYLADNVLRRIGRIAFPIFIFLLIEGFYHTRSRAKYLFRLSVFALVSEIPFDLGFNFTGTDFAKISWFGLKGSSQAHQVIPELSYQNVFFTLAIGFALIWIADQLTSPGETENAGTLEIIFRHVICVAAVIGFSLGAQRFNCDYAAAGVLAIFAAYMASRTGNYLIVFLASVTVLAVLSSGIELYALAALPLIACYHGDKGKGLGKWFFYIFYPAHIFVLAVIKKLVVN